MGSGVGRGWFTQSPTASQPQLCLLVGIGGFMVRQRKSHTRVKKGPAAQAEVLSGDGQPDEGETGEGSSGAWEKVGITVPTGQCQGGLGGWLTPRAKRVVGPVGIGEESRQKNILRPSWEQRAQCPQRSQYLPFCP